MNFGRSNLIGSLASILVAFACWAASSPAPEPFLTEGSCVLSNDLRVYSVRHPGRVVGILKCGAKLECLGPAGEAYLRIRFRAGSNRLVEAACREEDLRRALRGNVSGTKTSSPSETIPVGSIKAFIAPSQDALVPIIRELSNARRDITVGMFYLSNRRIITELCKAADRGVRVRVLLDRRMSRSVHSAVLERLTSCGVELFFADVPDGGKMHLKCAVIDGETVITGATNWTDYAFGNNNEDTLILQSRPLAQRYQELLDDHIAQAEAYSGSTIPSPARTGRRSSPPLLGPEAGGTRRAAAQASVFFSPQDDARSALLADAAAASNRILAAMYFITDRPVVSGLCAVARSGRAQMTLIVDEVMLRASVCNLLDELAAAGIDIRCLKSRGRRIMHLKSVVVDDHIVWTGSGNWSRNAFECNVEDRLRIESRQLTSQYAKHLEALRQQAEPYTPLSRLISRMPAKTPRTGTNREVILPAGTWFTGLPPVGPRKDFESPFCPPRLPSVTVTGWVEYVSDGEYEEALLRLIRSARQSIAACMFEMPRRRGKGHLNRVVTALKRAARRGVYVYLVLHMPVSEDDDLSRDHSEWAEELRREGVDVRLGVPVAPIHAKMVVVDACKVLVGSHNWSDGAISGNRVHESSVLVVLPQQDFRLVKYILDMETVSDMRERRYWEDEIRLLRRLRLMTSAQRREVLKKFAGTGLK